MHVKDAMREHSIGEVAAAWFRLLEAYRDKSPGLAALVLPRVWAGAMTSWAGMKPAAGRRNRWRLGAAGGFDPGLAYHSARAHGDGL
jgi:hypothetical protein